MDPAASPFAWADIWKNLPGLAFGLTMTWFFVQERNKRDEERKTWNEWREARERDDRADRKDESAANASLATALSGLKDVILRGTKP